VDWMCISVWEKRKFTQNFGGEFFGKMIYKNEYKLVRTKRWLQMEYTHFL